MKRSYKPELMDDFSIRDNRVDLALKELKIINRFLGGISTTKSALKHFFGYDNKCLYTLDVGSGSSDNLIAAKEKHPCLKIISIDKNLRVLKCTSDATLKINSDAYKIPIKSCSCDIVHSSLFLHHFNETEIKLLMAEFIRVCRKGIVINDLRRSCFAYLGIKILTIFLSKSELVQNDAPLSVKKGFKKNDFIRLFAECGITNYVIKRKWAFRWMVVINK